MPTIGSVELLLLLVVVVLFLGTARLPALARALREARRELRRPADDRRGPRIE